MKYICIEDLITFINFINSDDDAVLWKNGINPVCLEDLVNDGISQKKVRTLQLEDPTNSLSSTPDYLEERVKKLEEAVWPKNIDYGSYSYSNSMAPAVKEVGFESRGEAIHILERMRDKIKKFGCITIAEYYYISGKPEYVSYKLFDYGWTNLNNVAIYSYLKKGGPRVYGLKLPDPLPVQFH